MPRQAAEQGWTLIALWCGAVCARRFCGGLFELSPLSLFELRLFELSLRSHFELGNLVAGAGVSVRLRTLHRPVNLQHPAPERSPPSDRPGAVGGGRAAELARATRSARVASQAAQLWYIKPPEGNDPYHRFLYIGSRWCMDPLDIGGSMGTVPRQESVPNGSMHHRELLKWHC